MEEKLKRILLEAAPQTNVDSISPETSLKADLGLSSLDFLMMVFSIEDEFGFEFTGEEQIETVGDVYSFVAAHATKGI